jgi:hypothetical protein
MHQLRQDIRSLPPAKAEEFMKRLGDDAADDWVFRARDAQLPPPDLGAGSSLSWLGLALPWWQMNEDALNTCSMSRCE